MKAALLLLPVALTTGCTAAEVDRTVAAVGTLGISEVSHHEQHQRAEAMCSQGHWSFCPR